MRPSRVLELRSVRGTGGGPEKTILLGAARSDPQRYLMTVCYLRDNRDESFGPAAKAEGLPIDYVEIRERNSLDPGIWPKLRRLVHDRRIDIVHAHDYKTDLLALLLARCDRIIPLSTAHGWTGHSRREQFYYFAGKRLLRRFPRVIAVSSDIRQELLRCGSAPERVEVILNGIDPEAFTRVRGREPEARLRLGLPVDRTIVGAVGRLEPQKRFDLLMQAFADVRRNRPGLLLAIAGEGGSRAELEEHIRRLGINDGCVLLGHQADIIGFHHAIDIFVQSSKYEGTPNAVLEAMAMESPIVATNVGGTAELVRDGVDGVIIPPNDLSALREAIIRLLNDRDAAATRARAARLRVEYELSFDHRMRKVEGVYDELMMRYGGKRQCTTEPASSSHNNAGG